MTWLFVAFFCIADTCGRIEEKQPSGEACLQRVPEFRANWHATAPEKAELKFTACIGTPAAGA